MSDEKQKLRWSDLSDDSKKELGMFVAKLWIDLEKQHHREMMEDLFTPFWVKWWRKLKAKFSKKSKVV